MPSRLKDRPSDLRPGSPRSVLAEHLPPPTPLAAGRLNIIDDEHLTFRLKTPWSDGTSLLVLSPLELIEKLAALVPPPRLNLIRYHGVLAPNARDRKHIVPDAPLTDEPTIQPAAVDTPQARAHRLSWAALLARVFDIDVTVVPHAEGACASSQPSPRRPPYAATWKASACRLSHP